MMNVKLPNGQIVKNVPDGTTKEELREKLNNSSIVSSWESNESTFTGEKTDVALLVPAKKGDNTAGLGLNLTKISDKDATIGPEGDRFFTPNVSKLKGNDSTGFTLPGLLNHPELYKRHPELKDLEIRIGEHEHFKGNTETAAVYDPSGDYITLTRKNIRNKDELRTALLHEIQHRIDFKNTNRVVKDGKLENYDAKAKKAWESNVTETLAEITEDNKYVDSTGKDVSENYLVTQHLKRLYRKYSVDYFKTDVPNGMEFWTTANSQEGPPTKNEDESRKRLNDFITELAEVESHTKNVKERTGTTSASGYFQFVKGSAKAAARRTKRYFGKLDWLDEVERTGEVMHLSYEKQKLLAIGDLLEKKGSDEYFRKLFTAKSPEEIEIAKRNIYKDLHHTDVDKKDLRHRAAIYRNMNRVWNKYGYN